MRHKKRRLLLNRFTAWHEATIKSLARNMLLHESMKTTLHRAKAVRPVVEKLITLTKANTLSAKREAFRLLDDHKLVSMLFGEIGPRFAKRTSGYTRIINLGKRRGDDAKLVIFELTEQKPKVKKVKKTKEAKPEAGKNEGQVPVDTTSGEKKPEATAGVALKEKPPITKKPSKKFLGGIRSIFKKERDSL